MLSDLLTQARGGGLDGALLATKQFYLTLVLILVPFIPSVRSIPRRVEGPR